MTEAVQISIIANAATILALIITRLWSRSEHRATARKMTQLDDVVTSTHSLVNSGMAEQLFIGMVAAESLYAAKPNDINRDLATEARRKYEEHQKRQAVVDATKATLK